MNMNIEEQNIERANQETRLSELSQDLETLNEEERNSPFSSMERMTFGSMQASKSERLSLKIPTAVVAYGLHKLSESAVVREVVEGCKESFGEKITDFGEKIGGFFTGVYEDIKGFFTSNDVDSKALEKWGSSYVEQRDFGLDKCTKAAKEIFNPGVIENWANLSLEQRKEIAGTYAKEVADAFELQNYTGVYFENLEPGVYGYNNGDGSIHLSNDIVAAWTSPLEIMNTITHELRHQYQSEAIRGLHNVPEDVVKEWATAKEIYNYDQPYCYDPWGYTYNPLEIDARYAGETVVRNYTHDMINA